MPYLNWRDAQIAQEVHRSHELQPDLSSELPSEISGEAIAREFWMRLVLNAAQIQELLAHLEEIFLEGGAELRTDLPREWIVFWKLREGESRLLLAHPQADQWVATLALSEEHGKRLIEALRGLRPGESLSVGALAGSRSLGGPQTLSMTNVEFLIARS